MTDLIGTRLNQYELIEIVRRGGMATVYKAYQENLDRFVAVKVLVSNRDPQFAARFKREARAIAALQHHNILPVYDYGEQPDQGLLFLVMQYVENGNNLGDMLGKPMAAPLALRLTSHVLDALDYAHKRGVVHRDIKPANVLMPSPNWPMLGDFGIVKLQNDTQSRLTLANQIIGTAAYMAPEQATGRPIDARTDLYAAGVVLYELVTGRVPFDSDTPMAVLTKHVYEPPPPPRSLNPDIPAVVEALLQVALAKDPSQRFQSAADMSSELSQVALQIERDSNRSQITGLYQLGLQAFGEGHLDTAIEQLSRLLALDPQYEDASELLQAARDEQERNRTEARQRLDLLQQRRQSNLQQPRPPTSEGIIAPAPVPTPAPRSPATTKLPPLDDDALVAGTSQPAPQPPPLATIKLPAVDAQGRASTSQPAPPPPPLATTRMPAVDAQGRALDNAQPGPAAPPLATRQMSMAEAQAASAPPSAPSGTLDVAPAPSVVPAPPAAGRKLPFLWIILGVAALALVVGLLFALRGRGSGSPTAPTPAAQPSPAEATSAGSAPSPAAAPTAASNAEEATATPPSTDAGEPPPAPAGAQVWADDFSDIKKSGLENAINGEDFQRGIHSPGVYHMRILAPNDTRVELLPRQAYQNFTAQIDLNDFSDDLNGTVAQGLVFRARDRQHYYALLIDPRNGKYSLHRQDGDTLAELIPWTASPLIHQQKDVNKLRVDGAGDAFTFYLNDNQLDKMSDKTYDRGMLGFIVANADADKPHMHFDNLAVWSDDAAPAASSLEPQLKDPNGDLVLIAGGPFVLGSNENHDEPPQLFQLPDFYIDRTEVTNARYRACVDAKACSPLLDVKSQTHPDYFNDPKFDSYPVVEVSWQQATAFCGWANKRLPTEAEWEKAASWDPATRQKFVFPWGNEFNPALLNSDESKLGDTNAVGSYEPEVNKTVDMAGNVSEWTSTLFRPYPYNEADGRENPKGDGDRVYRGGSWAQTQGKAHTIYRQPASPTAGFLELGFRCAKTP